MKTYSNTYIIGCGGVGSWLTPSLCMLTDPHRVWLMDADILERKNLNRQLFTEADIGKVKSAALARLYGCNHKPGWYHAGAIDHTRYDWLMVCVDNHRARQQALAACDIRGCRAIVAANETHSAEAFFYQPEWKGDARRDPRIYYPEIVTDTTNDPMAQSIGCTGEAQQENRQLVSANFMAAALAQHLYVLWAMEARKLDAEVRTRLPFKLSSTLTRVSYELVEGPTETKKERAV